MTPQDLQSHVWKRFTQHLKERLAALREINDVMASPDKTALTRGQISEVKRLLSLPTGSERADDFPYQGEVLEPKGDTENHHDY